MVKIFVFFVLGFVCNHGLSAQHSWELYVGGNHSNIIHSINGQSILYVHTKNAPLWNNGAQIGLDYLESLGHTFKLTLGVRFQLRGDRMSFHEIAPENEFHSLRFIDLMLPINFNYRLLQSKDIFLKAGFSGSYVVHQNKEDYLAIFPLRTFDTKLGLAGQIGFKFLIFKRVSGELMYSQGLTNIYKLPIGPGTFYPSGSEFVYKHQAFEFSTFYRL